MKVLIVGRGKPSLEYPLNGGFEFEQAKALASKGLDVTYFAVDLRSIRRKRKYGISQGVENNVRWYSINVPIGAIPLLVFCHIGGIALKYLFNKVFLSKDDYPDIIHAHFTDIGRIASLLSMRINIPLVITEHSSAMNQSSITHDLLKIAKVSYSQASKVIAVSNSLAKNIYEKTHIMPLVVPNMVKLDVFLNCKHKNHKGFHVASVGNLVPGKRFSNLISAVAEIINVNDDIILHIIGDGELRKDLEKQVSELKLEKYILFHGYKDARDIVSIYEICDCFALVSASETFGVVYIEAISAGLPVIATRCGGPEDFVNEQNGILIDVDNHYQLCAALLKMKQLRSSYSQNQLATFASEHFSPDRIACDLIKIYKSILNYG